MGGRTTGRASRHTLTVTLTHTLEGALRRPEDGGGHLGKSQAQDHPIESLRPQSSLGLLALLWGSEELVPCGRVHPVSCGCPPVGPPWQECQASGL